MAQNPNCASRIWYNRSVREPRLHVWVLPPSGEEWWVETPLDGRWQAHVRFMLGRDGIPVVAEVRVFPDEFDDNGIARFDNATHAAGEWSQDPDHVPDGGLPTRTLRSLRLGDARSFFDEMLRQRAEDANFKRHLPESPFLRPETLASVAAKRPGPAGRQDHDYAAIAARYLAHVQAGDPTPITTLATDLGRPKSHVRELLTTARRRGLLSRTQRGRAGGRLTDKGLAALQSRPPADGAG
jgi:hypothetical protein